jgi:hypothetical protein
MGTDETIPFGAAMCVCSGLFMRFAWMVQPWNYLLLACHASNESVQLYHLSRWLEHRGKAWLVADGWCWFVLREEYCWLVLAGCWWLVCSERKVLLAGG